MGTVLSLLLSTVLKVGIFFIFSPQKPVRCTVDEKRIVNGIFCDRVSVVLIQQENDKEIYLKGFTGDFDHLFQEQVVLYFPKTGKIIEI